MRTYVAIVAACSGDRVQIVIEGDADASQAAFPPMLLLPLVEHAIASGRLTRPEDGALTLRTVKTNGKLHVTRRSWRKRLLPRTTRAKWSDECASICRRSSTPKRRLELRRRAGHGTEIVMEIPG